MQTIYKYLIPHGEKTFELCLSKGAKPLHVNVQNGQACMWVQIDLKAAKERRIFWIIGTGRELPCCENLQYISTLHWCGEVWHIYTEGDS